MHNKPNIQQQGGRHMKKHDYGLEKKQELTIRSAHWNLIPHKKVIMSNVWICKNRITVDKIVKRLEGWGIHELELTEAVWLTEAVVKAIEAKQSTANISRMFKIEFSIYDKFGYAGVITKESIAESLYEKLFKKIYEDEEKIIVKLKWRCLL